MASQTELQIRAINDHQQQNKLCEQLGNRLTYCNLHTYCQVRKFV